MVFKPKQVKEQAKQEPVQVQKPVQAQELVNPVRRVLVVKELPMQALKEAVDENGQEYELVTIEEALTELVEFVRRN